MIIFFRDGKLLDLDADPVKELSFTKQDWDAAIEAGTIRLRNILARYTEYEHKRDKPVFRALNMQFTAMPEGGYPRITILYDRNLCTQAESLEIDRVNSALEDHRKNCPSHCCRCIEYILADASDTIERAPPLPLGQKQVAWDNSPGDERCKNPPTSYPLPDRGVKYISPNE